MSPVRSPVRCGPARHPAHFDTEGACMSDDVTGSPQPSALEEIRRGIVNVAVPHNEPPAVVRRRRIVVAIVLVLGAAAIGHGAAPASRRTGVLLAVAGAGGGLDAGRGGGRAAAPGRRPVAWAQRAAGVHRHRVGLVLGGVFLLGGFVVQEIPAVAELIAGPATRRPGSWRLVVPIAIAQRDRRRDVLPRRAVHGARSPLPTAISTLLYTAAMMAGGNLMVGVAALILGTVCAMERRAPPAGCWRRC